MRTEIGVAFNVSEAIGRWCGATVWYNDSQYGACGGELLYRRRLEGEQIVSYLICQFCGHQTPMLACDTATGEHTSLAGEREEKA
jgi:hypothetical protein